MDPIVLGFIALLGIAAGISIALALNRGRILDRLAEDTHASSWEDIERQLRSALDETDAARWEATQTAADIRYLADQIGVGIVRLDDGLQVVFANRAAHVFLDRAPGTMDGRPALEAFVDPRIEAVAREATELGSASAEVTLRAVEGPQLALRARRSPVSGVWLVLEDVSELRRLQRIRAEFIDNLSHELRTPLTNVSLLAETAERDAAQAPPKLRERIAKIGVEASHLVQMVNELLDMSRIESGGTELLLADVDVVRLAAMTVERLRLFAERQGIRLRFEPSGPVPRIRGDEERLGQVIINLLHNAVKFSPNGGDVVVRVAGEGDEVILSVADPGVGISKADLGRIFERFYKVDRARVRGRGGGTGLGLAIARQVVETHGGRIWAESEEGHGATFKVALPAAGAILASEPPEVPAAASSPRNPAR